MIVGLILVPNGEYFGYKMGDPRDEYWNGTNVYKDVVAHRTSAVKYLDSNDFNNTYVNMNLTEVEPKNSHPWGVFFTILGTVLLDFDADACQSPARAYLLDVTLPGKKNYNRKKTGYIFYYSRGSCSWTEHIHNYGRFGWFPRICFRWNQLGCNRLR